MKDYLLILRTEGNVWSDLSPGQLQKHMEHGTAYIGKLMKEGKLKNASPVDKGSRIVSESNGILKDGPFNESKEVVAGKFFISAKDINKAGVIFKAKPN